jgi:hypothetical protein
MKAFGVIKGGDAIKDQVIERFIGSDFRLFPCQCIENPL